MIISASRRAALAALAALALLASAAPARELRLDLATAEIRLGEFPHPLRDLTGAVFLAGGLVELDPLSFRVLSSDCVARGFFSPGSRRHDIRLAVASLAPDDLHRLVPDLPFFRAVASIEVDLRFLRDERGKRRVFRAATDRFRIDGTGVARGLGAAEGRDLRAAGTLDGKKRTIDELSFSAYGGSFSFRGDTESFAAALADVRLERILAGHPALAGKLRGRLAVTLDRDGDALDGSFRARDGEARDFAFLATLARALRIDRLAALSFREFSAVFRRRGETTEVRDLKVRSELADLSAHLTVTGAEGRLSGGGRLVVRLRVIAESRRLKRLGLLKDVMRRNSLTLKVRIRGTIDDPDLDIVL